MKDARITVRVSSDAKEDWMEHVDEYGRYDDLTELIRHSVETQIAEDKQDFSIEDEFDSIKTGIRLLVKHYTDIRNISEEINQEMATTQELAEQVSHLTEVIIESQGDDADVIK